MGSNWDQTQYYPWGQVQAGQQPSETQGFGTYVLDSGSGLYYADQRYYNQSWGRFLTADPSDRNIDQATPLTWNRYAYADGDPINGNDPTGLYLYDDGYGCSDMGGGDDGTIVYGGANLIDAAYYYSGSSATFGPGLDVPIGGDYAGLFSGSQSIGSALNGSDGMLAIFGLRSAVAGSTVAAGTVMGLTASPAPLTSGGAIVGSGVLNGLNPDVADNFTNGAAELVTTASNLNLSRVFDNVNCMRAARTGPTLRSHRQRRRHRFSL